MGLTVTLSGASLMAQTCLHGVLQVTGKSLVTAESAIWRAVGIHRFKSADDFAFAVVPDMMLFTINAGILWVLRRVCATAVSKRFKHTVLQVIKLQRLLRASGREWKIDGGGGFHGSVMAVLKKTRRGRAEAQAQAQTEAARRAGEGGLGGGFGGELGGEFGGGGRGSDGVREGGEVVDPAGVKLTLTLTGSEPDEAAFGVSAEERAFGESASASESESDADEELRFDDGEFALEPFVDNLPRFKASPGASAIWRALGSVAAATGGAWMPAGLPCVLFLSAVAHFFSHAANRRVPRVIDSFGTVQSMRRWAIVCCVSPYYVAVVEVALGEVPGVVGFFGLAGSGEDRRVGSDWRWLCQSLGLWPMANMYGRLCCMESDQVWAWVWCVVALGMFGVGGNGPLHLDDEPREESAGSAGSIAAGEGAEEIEEDGAADPLRSRAAARFARCWRWVCVRCRACTACLRRSKSKEDNGAEGGTDVATAEGGSMALAPPEASGSTTTGETAIVKPAVASMKTGEIEGRGDDGQGGGEWTTKDDDNDGASGMIGGYGFETTKQQKVQVSRSLPTVKMSRKDDDPPPAASARSSSTLAAAAAAASTGTMSGSGHHTPDAPRGSGPNTPRSAKGIVEEESPPKGVLKPPARQRHDPREALLRKLKAQHEAETDRKLAVQKASAANINAEKRQLFANAKDGSGSAQLR